MKTDLSVRLFVQMPCLVVPDNCIYDNGVCRCNTFYYVILCQEFGGAITRYILKYFKLIFAVF